MFSHLAFALPTPILLLILSYPNLSTPAYQTCYNPDGSVSTDGLIPCNSTLPNSACCGFLDSCTATGICLGSAGLPYRGGCTDPTWSSGLCTTECMTDVQSNRKYTAPSNIYHCGPVGVFDGDVCCQTMSGDSCCDLNATFDYKNSGVSFTPSLDLRIEQARSGSTATATSTIYVTVTASPSSTSNGNSNSAAEESGSVASTTPAATNSNLSFAIGAGIGIPLGICSIGLFAFFFWRERAKLADLREKKLAESGSQWGGSMSSEERAYWERREWREWMYGGQSTGPQFEMNGNKSPMELDYRRSARELDGGGGRI